MRTIIDMPSPTPLSGDADFFGRWSSSTADSDIDEIICHWRRQNRQSLDQKGGTDPETQDADPDGSQPSELPPTPAPTWSSPTPRESSMPGPKRSRWLVG